MLIALLENLASHPTSAPWINTQPSCNCSIYEYHGPRKTSSNRHFEMYASWSSGAPAKELFELSRSQPFCFDIGRPFAFQVCYITFCRHAKNEMLQVEHGHGMACSCFCRKADGNWSAFAWNWPSLDVLTLLHHAQSPDQELQRIFLCFLHSINGTIHSKSVAGPTLDAGSIADKNHGVKDLSVLFCHVWSRFCLDVLFQGPGDKSFWRAGSVRLDLWCLSFSLWLGALCALWLQGFCAEIVKPLMCIKGFAAPQTNGFHDQKIGICTNWRHCIQISNISSTLAALTSCSSCSKWVNLTSGFPLVLLGDRAACGEVLPIPQESEVCFTCTLRRHPHTSP